MKKGILLLFLAWLVAPYANAQVTYFGDILGNGFKQATIVFPPDYEGSVTCTVVRKLAPGQKSKSVLYVHGFNDYFFQEEMADRFIKEGYNFYAVDLRKYGRSWLANQKLNDVRDLSEYFADIDTVLNIMRSEGSGPILLCGHSLGGLVASLYADARTGKELFDAVLLNSPYFDPEMHSVLKKKPASLILNRAEKHPETTLNSGMNPLYGESLHKDAFGEWNYNLSWKPHEAPPISYGWIKAMYDAQQKVAAGLQIGKPVLVLHAARSLDEKKWSEAFFTADAVLNVSDIARMARNIQGQYSIQAVQGGMHDLVLSRKAVRDDVYETIFSWARRNIK
ncbi:alpha/beta hydrolase [Dyadobacter sediminis]|uniref:Alpha/beta hydrolase n=1 Tax=Dyadobacter sediminis TaxID=1493691 RepID=A0A5R9KIS0_9BACT|nr:alpha/beta hydrolase [Dyadobacter sediminis]TLU96105.1 alpha/beta hydrolase [Dyadobacter sediminis]GGB79296.1 alpha/beta hydrolase [Dyadobacter sediminis]